MRSRKALSVVLVLALFSSLPLLLGCLITGGADADGYYSETGALVEVRCGKRRQVGAAVGPHLVSTVMTSAGEDWTCDGRSAEKVITIQSPHGRIVILSVSGAPFSQDDIFKMNPGGAADTVITEDGRYSLKRFTRRGTRYFGSPVVDKFGYIVGHLYRANVVEGGSSKSKTVVLAFPEVLDATALSSVRPKE